MLVGVAEWGSPPVAYACLYSESCVVAPADPRAHAPPQSLSVLDASFNQLHEVPACVGQLTCLTALRLQFNTIEFVHPEVGN